MNMQVILNPKIKSKARKWLVKRSQEIKLQHQSNNRELVNAEEWYNNKKYHDNLKEFLALVLENEEVLKLKKYDKQVKSCI